MFEFMPPDPNEGEGINPRVLAVALLVGLLIWGLALYGLTKILEDISW